MSESHIAAFYESDHDRLDMLFKDFQRQKRNDPKKAKAAFDEFSSGLRRHIAWEEEILFPLFERRSGMHTGGPTHVMRTEHREILKHLDAIREKVDTGDPESGYDEQMMLNILALHNNKEENILYPAIDRALNAKERENVFSQMKNLPAQ